MKVSKEELNAHFTKAKIAIFSKKASAFYTTVLFSLKHQWSDAIPTACTDGVSLIINPDWFCNMKRQQQIGLLLHETEHVVYEHMFRLGNRDKRVFNEACDHAINLRLLEQGYELPDGGCADPQFTGMSAEAIYEDLMQNPDKQQTGYEPDIEFSDQLSEEEREKLKNKVEGIIIKAVTQAKMSKQHGDIPNDILVKVDEILNPKLPWYVILENYINDTIKDDYSWQKPNRRYVPDYYLPSMYGDTVDNIAVAVDTSGSVTDEEFQRFISEIHNIKEIFNPKKLTVIDFDHVIKDIHVLEEDKQITDIKFTGRGGTCVKSPIDWAIKNQPNVFIMFTDGYFTPYEPAISFPFIWCIHSNEKFQSNIGTIIHLPMD